MDTLYDQNGLRLYLNENERKSFLNSSTGEKREIKAFCHVLALTGCRVSEALQITPRRVDLSEKTITFRTLKQRREKPVFRSVPVPDELLEMLGNIYGIQEIQKRGNAKELDTPLFSWHRGSAWAVVKRVMVKSAITDGPHKTAKGLRHGYGVHAVKNGVQLHMLSKWMGHAKMENTAIYAQALGEEEREIAARMWG